MLIGKNARQRDIRPRNNFRAWIVVKNGTEGSWPCYGEDILAFISAFNVVDNLPKRFSEYWVVGHSGQKEVRGPIGMRGDKELPFIAENPS